MAHILGLFQTHHWSLFLVETHTRFHVSLTRPCLIFLSLKDACIALSESLVDSDMQTYQLYCLLSHARSFSLSARADAQESMRYWEQFRPSQESKAEQWEKKRKRNFRLVGYCLITMVVSIGAHVLFFRYHQRGRIEERKKHLGLRHKHWWTVNRLLIYEYSFLYSVYTFLSPI